MRYSLIPIAVIAGFSISVASAQTIYWTENGKIRRANANRTNVEDVLVSGSPFDLDLDIANRYIYWTDSASFLLRRSTLNGGNVVDLISRWSSDPTSRNPPRGISVAARIYWTEGSGTSNCGWLMQADLDGSNIARLPGMAESCHHTQQGVEGIDAKSEAGIYWCAKFQNEIVKCCAQVVVESPIADSPSGIAIHDNGGKIYWTNAEGRNVSRSNLDGSGAEVIFGGPVGMGIAIDKVRGKIYWSQGTAIRRANLDGTDVEVFLDGLSGVGGIAIDNTNSHLIPAVSTWGLAVTILLLLSAGTLIMRRGHDGSSALRTNY